MPNAAGTRRCPYDPPEQRFGAILSGNGSSLPVPPWPPHKTEYLHAPDRGGRLTKAREGKLMAFCSSGADVQVLSVTVPCQTRVSNPFPSFAVPVIAKGATHAAVPSPSFAVHYCRVGVINEWESCSAQRWSSCSLVSGRARDRRKVSHALHA